MDYKKKYQRIVDDLVKKSFPELKGKFILINEYDGLSYGGTFFAFFFGILWVNRKARNFTYDQQIGLIAHELCHFSIFFSRGFFIGLLKGMLYFMSKNQRRSEEDRTIKLSIEKGYAKQYYSFFEVASEDEARKEMNKNYWSLKEIKSYAKKIGKW